MTEEEKLRQVNNILDRKIGTMWCCLAAEQGRAKLTHRLFLCHCGCGNIYNVCEEHLPDYIHTKEITE
jgi:hypothetical protein